MAASGLPVGFHGRQTMRPQGRLQARGATTGGQRRAAYPSQRGSFAIDPRVPQPSPVFQFFGFTMVAAGLLLAWVFILAFVL